MTTDIRFEPVTDAHVEYVAANMREADRVEVWESHRKGPLVMLRASVDASHYSATVTAHGEPLVIFGLVIRDILNGTGVPWLLGTDQALKHKREFLVQTPEVIERMLEICPHLCNYVHAENRISVRWLKWLGFTLDEAQPLASTGAMFHKFYLSRSD